MAEIEIKNLTIEQGDFKLRCDKLSINKEEKVAILGENGSGKTTLLLAISGNMPIQNGSVYLCSKPVSYYKGKEKAKMISFLPQFSDVLFNMDVFNAVLYGRYAQTESIFTMDDYKQTKHIISTFDLEHLKTRGYHELSGGEKRRVMIAKTINQNAKIDILDEPFANMDIKHSLHILKYLKENKKTIIASVHDINLAIAFFDRIVILKKGKIIFNDKTDRIDKEIVDEAYEVDSNVCNARFLFV